MITETLRLGPAQRCGCPDINEINVQFQSSDKGLIWVRLTWPAAPVAISRMSLLVVI